MQLDFTNPHPALRPFVKGYFYIELNLGSSPPPLDVHPIGHNTMAFTLHPKAVFSSNNENYNFSLSYHGHICKHISIQPLTLHIKMVIVSFTATGATQLFGISQHELINQIVPIEDVISSSVSLKTSLEQGISCEKHATALIENWLLRQRAKKKDFQYAANIDFACSLIQLHNGNIRIKKVCNEAGMSQTNLQDHFKEMIGTSPKLYCRIIRFIALYQYILTHNHVEWSDLVYRYSFFDQAHFIRDFKTFFGYTPSKIHLANGNVAKKIIQKTA